MMPTNCTLSSFMRRLLTGYAVNFNRTHYRTGHLFQNRYKSTYIRHLGPRKTRKNTKKHEKLNYYSKTVIHHKGYVVKLFNLLISFVYFVLFVDNCFF